MSIMGYTDVQLYYGLRSRRWWEMRGWGVMENCCELRISLTFEVCRPKSKRKWLAAIHVIGWCPRNVLDRTGAVINRNSTRARHE